MADNKRGPIPTWCFAVVVVRRGDEFLLVHERKHQQLWYLPAGRVEFGETFEEAAVRETLEETGIDVALTGVVRVEHSLVEVGARLRVIFTADPVESTVPKSIADKHSLEAAWVPFEELSQFPLRSADVRMILEHLYLGGRVHPLDVLRREGSGFMK